MGEILVIVGWHDYGNKRCDNERLPGDVVPHFCREILERAMVRSAIDRQLMRKWSIVFPGEKRQCYFHREPVGYAIGHVREHPLEVNVSAVDAFPVRKKMVRG